MNKQAIRYIGMFMFLTGFVALHWLILSSTHTIDATAIEKAISKTEHRKALLAILDGKYENQSLFSTIETSKDLIQQARQYQEDAYEKIKQGEASLPKGVSEWDFRIGDWEKDSYLLALARSSLSNKYEDTLRGYAWKAFLLCIIGALVWISVRFMRHAGIQNDGIFHNTLLRGINAPIRNLFLAAVVGGILFFGYLTKSVFWTFVTTGIAILITGLVFWMEKREQTRTARTIAPNINAWLGILLGVYLIGFYILLYWSPSYLSNAIAMLDPLSLSLSGHPASQWFLYGFLYTIAMLVMGVRMFAKYRHDKYQLLRTGSVLFFQTCFAFILPEIMVRLNYPYHDFKNIWPLDYDFLFDWNINNLIQSGNVGLFILVWGILLAIVGVPLFTYLYGKRWYCSWICGCGGLAETVGDPFRQLSDKSLRAWRFERYIIHGVLVAAVVMTVFVLYTYFTGVSRLLGFDSYHLRSWYGFFIGAGFSGVVGTGFYPLMGNRVWCRFGCPLAAYLGLVQRFYSRYRITSNGSQCISCGNCSVYCEMGIDVRWYAQRGQDIVRSSCVGCGICSAVCPRGVLRLENSSIDIKQRASVQRALHIDKDGVILQS